MSILAQNIIVGIIILAALAWIIYKLIRTRKKGSVGCSCCSMAYSCPHRPQNDNTSHSCPHCQNHSNHEINKNME